MGVFFQNKVVVVMISIIFLFTLIFGAWFLFKNNDQVNNKDVVTETLTQAEKLKILGEISTSTVATTSEAKKDTILSQTDTKASVSSISYEEKLKILNGAQ